MSSDDARGYDRGGTRMRKPLVSRVRLDEHRVMVRAVETAALVCVVAGSGDGGASDPFGKQPTESNSEKVR